MTASIAIMIILGILFIFASFFVTEKLQKKEDNFNIDLLTVNEDYEFSDRELGIIKRKIEDVIADNARNILYETNESLSNMANEKTLALGDYAVTVCEEIERNHKEVMFLYSMLDDKQKEIMNTVKNIDAANKETKDMLSDLHEQISDYEEIQGKAEQEEETETMHSALEQLSALSKMKKDVVTTEASQAVNPIVETTITNEDTFEAEMQALKEEDSDDFSVEETVNEAFEAEFEKDLEENENSNDVILEMYQNGNSILEIAKQLGLGVGEVKLVVDLYQGE